MCCLFGIIDYKHNLTRKQMNHALSTLATSSEARGTDATGIAYNHGAHLSIYKRPAAAHKLHFKIPAGVTAVMGHTRLTTQGDEKQNYNNHPFYGHAGVPFALAHNGMICNDEQLRVIERLPRPHIKTDSYVAVQLLEKSGKLTFDSLRQMAEQLDGTFTITVMDADDNMYFVKGNNPMCIYHYPMLGLYIYASTEEILTVALSKIRFIVGKPERISLTCGEILRIDAYGRRSLTHFNADKLLYDRWFYPFRSFCNIDKSVDNTESEQAEYIEELKSVACYLGFSPDYIDYLLEEGFDTMDIEEILYCS